MPVSIETIHPVDSIIEEDKVPWTPENPPAVSKNWSAEEQKICTRVANAVLRSGGWSTASDSEKKKLEGTAIRACIRAAGKTKFPGGKKSLEGLSNQHLMKDFRLITNEYSVILSGGESEFESREELEDFADGVLNEILKRDITFHFSKFDDAARALMIRLYVPKSDMAILLRGSAPALITGGYKKAVVKGREFKFDKPLILAGESGLAFGIIRFHGPVVIGLEEFKSRFESHRITERERKRRWPDREEFYYYAIKDYLPFSEPKPIKNFPRPPTVPIIKDVQMAIPPVQQIVPEWLADLAEEELIAVHDDLHRIYQENEDVYTAHKFVVEEIERRGVNHRPKAPIDHPIKQDSDQELGGAGSGNWGHKSTPGIRGGSRPGGGYGRILMSSRDGEKLTGPQSDMVKNLSDRAEKGEVPHLKDLLKPPKKPALKSSTENVPLGNLTGGEEKRVRNYLKTLPQEHVDSIASVKGSGGSLGKNVAGRCDEYGYILVSQSPKAKWSKESLTHEVGHAVHFKAKKGYADTKIGDISNKDLIRKLAAANQSHSRLPLWKALTTYSRKNEQEFFAVSYRAYTSKAQVKALQRVSRQMESQLGFSWYDTMKDVFGGVEYV